MKIIKNLLFSTILCSAFANSSYAATVTEQFTDIEDTWYTPYVQTSVDAGYASGKSANTFDPMGEVTGAEFTVMLCNAFYGRDLMIEKDLVSGEGGWAELWINTLKNAAPEEDILHTLNYYGSLSRYDASYIIASILHDKNFSVSSNGAFEELVDLHNCLHPEYLDLVLSAEIMSGKNGSKFDGQGTLNRAEACVIITNLLDCVREESYVSYQQAEEELYQLKLLIDYHNTLMPFYENEEECRTFITDTVTNNLEALSNMSEEECLNVHSTLYDFYLKLIATIDNLQPPEAYAEQHKAFYTPLMEMKQELLKNLDIFEDDSKSFDEKVRIISESGTETYNNSTVNMVASLESLANNVTSRYNLLYAEGNDILLFYENALSALESTSNSSTKEDYILEITATIQGLEAVYSTSRAEELLFLHLITDEFVSSCVNVLETQIDNIEHFEIQTYDTTISYFENWSKNDFEGYTSFKDGLSEAVKGLETELNTVLQKITELMDSTTTPQTESEEVDESIDPEVTLVMKNKPCKCFSNSIFLLATKCYRLPPKSSPPRGRTLWNTGLFSTKRKQCRIMSKKRV